MTISRIPKDEPKRWKNGCFSVLVRLLILAVVLGAVLYAALYWAFTYGSGGFTY